MEFYHLFCNWHTRASLLLMFFIIFNILGITLTSNFSIGFIKAKNSVKKRFAVEYMRMEALHICGCGTFKSD